MKKGSRKSGAHLVGNVQFQLSVTEMGKGTEEYDFNGKFDVTIDDAVRILKEAFGTGHGRSRGTGRGVKPGSKKKAKRVHAPRRVA